MGIARPEDGGSIALLGTTPTFWPLFKTSPEYADGAPHPLDRWSTRVVSALGQTLAATQVSFPFGGPPHVPFVSWALASGEIVGSPFGLLWHPTAGFWISLRGALHFEHRLEPEAPPMTYAGPNSAPCPVGALGANIPYDVSACKAHLRRPEGQACLTKGCQIRRACPTSQAYGREPEQSAFHMRAFLEAP